MSLAQSNKIIKDFKVTLNGTGYPLASYFRDKRRAPP